MDTLPIVADDPPAAGPERALDPPFAGIGVVAVVAAVVLAAAELLLEVALTIPKAPPATTMTAAPTAMDLVSLRENMN
ncbi:MAG: hypothetical protein M3Q31_18925 [Actinomycetota bacterium]|nr:hypothetical protein [Actinomycetota bacterium]